MLVYRCHIRLQPEEAACQPVRTAGLRVGPVYVGFELKEAQDHLLCDDIKVGKCLSDF